MCTGNYNQLVITPNGKIIDKSGRSDHDDQWYFGKLKNTIAQKNNVAAETI